MGADDAHLLGDGAAASTGYRLGLVRRFVAGYPRRFDIGSECNLTGDSCLRHPESASAHADVYFPATERLDFCPSRSESYVMPLAADRDWTDHQCQPAVSDGGLDQRNNLAIPVSIVAPDTTKLRRSLSPVSRSRPSILLASASSRRRELLSQIGISFQSRSQNIDELRLAGESATDYVQRMATEKVESALELLMQLSNRDHQVLTAVTVASASKFASSICRSTVSFRAISQAEAGAYWRTGEPAGKAGGYAIQGYAAVFVKKLSGSYSGVMGLPLYETMQLLNQFGIECLIGKAGG